MSPAEPRLSNEPLVIIVEVDADLYAGLVSVPGPRPAPEASFTHVPVEWDWREGLKSLIYY